MPKKDFEKPITGPARCAGEFKAWLQDICSAFSTKRGTSVPCGDCRACCRSGYFIPVHHHEWSTRAAIPERLLIRPPLTTSGAHYELISTTRGGHCALHRGGACSIYRQRPQACRDYDCRVFAAAGLLPGQREVDRQVALWRFHYTDEESRRLHTAVQSAARFVAETPWAFPRGAVPQRPADIAVVALKSHRVFLSPCGPDRTPEAIAKAIAQACRAFDATGLLAPDTAHLP